MAITDKLTNIADAIREKTSTTDTMTMAQMPDLIRSIKSGGSESKPWVRPSDWPDLDSAWENHKAEFGTDAMFFTICTRDAKAGLVGKSTMEFRFVGYSSKSTITATWGHVANGKFVEDVDGGSTTSLLINVTVPTTIDGDYAVLRFTTNGTNLGWIAFYESKPSDSSSYKKWDVYDIREICGGTSATTPLTTATYWQYAYYRLSTISTERYKLEITKKPTYTNFSLYYAFTYMYNLQDISITGDLSSATTLNLSNMCSNCYSLTSLALDLDTSSATTLNLNYMCYNCYSLTSLALDWDTSKVTSFTIGSIFNGCWMLEKFVVPTVWGNANTSITYSSFLNYDSLISLINALPTVTSTCTLSLHSSAKARLTSDDIAIATAKGWTVS